MHANGKIQAKVWYSEKEKIPLNQVIEQKTGKSEKQYAIAFHNFKINLSKGVPKFEKYDTINENKKLKLFTNFYFPIQIYKTTYEEIEQKEIDYTIEEAKEIALKTLEEKLKQQITNLEAIVNQQVNIKEEEGIIEVELIYEVLEEVGTKEKILF